MKTILVLAVLAIAHPALAVNFVWDTYTDATADTIRVYEDTGAKMVAEVPALNSTAASVADPTDNLCHRYFARACNDIGCTANSTYADWCPGVVAPVDPPPVEQQVPPSVAPGFRIQSIIIVPN